MVTDRDIPTEDAKDVLSQEWDGLVDVSRRMEQEMPLCLMAIGVLRSMGEATIVRRKFEQPEEYGMDTRVETRVRRARWGDAHRWRATGHVMAALEDRRGWVDTYWLHPPDDGGFHQGTDVLVALGELFHRGHADVRMLRDEDCDISLIKARRAE
jgi:hypothetical protein